MESEKDYIEDTEHCLPRERGTKTGKERREEPQKAIKLAFG